MEDYNDRKQDPFTGMKSQWASEEVERGCPRTMITKNRRDHVLRGIHMLSSGAR
jgi:hypothetical protein